MATIKLNPSSVSDYRRYLQIKSLPRFSFQGRTAWVPDEYAARLGLRVAEGPKLDYRPSGFLFDYQRDIARVAISKQKYAVFADCGLGKTLILLEFAHHAFEQTNGKVLIVSPLMVIPQTVEESRRFYGRDIRIVPAAELAEWLRTPGAEVGITNYEAVRDGLTPGTLTALILDESSMLKSHYGRWGTRLIDLGRQLDWKLCLTGTPAPNDRIEYANHAVFLDRFRTVNQFLATYFVNRGQTNERWELKPHALGPFYRQLSDWCVFLSDPSVYGWQDNVHNLPPINVHLHHVNMTPEQMRIARSVTGDLFVGNVGGITSRSRLSQLGKGYWHGETVPTNKPEFIRSLIASWPEESTIVWCQYNDEQSHLASLLGCPSIEGKTGHSTRQDIIDGFKAGRIKTIVTKPKILGFGLNLQVATRQVFSGLADSYESYYQAVKRSNRIGSTRPLNVHIPFTDVEHPMIETVLRKSHDIERDTQEQERLFRENGYNMSASG